MLRLEPEWLFRDGALREESLVVDDRGTIVAIGPRDEIARAHVRAPVEKHPGRALLPGLVSAHSHAFQVLLRGWAEHPRDFADWVASRLYPLVLELEDDVLEAASRLCFAEMALAGITTVGEFHYIHNGRDGTPRGNALDERVIRAARSVGLRTAFLRTIYDVQEKPGQARFHETPEWAIEATRGLAAKLAHDPLVTIMPAPHSLHGATGEAIQAAARLARERDVRWHIHLAEQKGDVERARTKHGATPLRVLDAMGVLDERTVIVHGVWLDEGERALLAERKASLVSCPATSIALGDGVAELGDLVARGVTVGLGTDMNARPDILGEARLAEYLQRGRSLRMNVLPLARGSGAGGAVLLDLATRGGARTLGLATGELAPGSPLDAVLWDIATPSLAPAARRGPEALLDALVATGSPALVKDVLVAGTRIVRDGRLVNVDLASTARRAAAAG